MPHLSFLEDTFMKSFKFLSIFIFTFLGVITSVSAKNWVENLLPDRIGIGIDQLVLDGEVVNEVDDFDGNVLTGITPTLIWNISEDTTFDLGYVNHESIYKTSVNVNALAVHAEVTESLGGPYFDFVFDYGINDRLKLFTSAGAGYFSGKITVKVDGSFEDDRINLFGASLEKSSWVPRIAVGFKFTPKGNWTYGLRQTYYWRDDNNKVQSTGFFVSYQF